MPYNRKKLNANKDKKAKDPNKFHLGRNLGTYLIFIGAGIMGLLILGAILAIFGGKGYMAIYNSNKVNPYQDDSHIELIQNPEYYEAKDFHLFDISLVAESIDTKDAHRIEFELKIVKNEDTPELIPLRYNQSGNMFEAVATSTYRAYASICVAADWVNVCQYSSSYTYITQSNIESTLENASHKHINVSLKEDQVFPMKVNTWPIPITIKTPEAYLLITFMELVNGANVNKFYIIHYSYDDYYVAGTTSPAI